MGALTNINKHNGGIMKAHKHAEVIKKWADGEVIEKMSLVGWEKVTIPFWNDDTTYRVKPKVYPESTLPYQALCSVWIDASARGGEGVATYALRDCANKAVEEFITSGEMMAYLKSEGIYQLIERGNYE
jgi:hypothetical protein